MIPALVRFVTADNRHVGGLEPPSGFVAIGWDTAHEFEHKRLKLHQMRELTATTIVAAEIVNATVNEPFKAKRAWIGRAKVCLPPLDDMGDVDASEALGQLADAANAIDAVIEQYCAPV